MDETQIYDFDDYRDFLNARFLASKKTRKTMTFQSFALANNRSRAYLKNILSKNRHLSLDSVEDVVNYLKLKPAEREYLIYQYLATQTIEPEIRLHFEKALLLLKDQICAETSKVDNPSAIQAEAKTHLFSSLKNAVIAVLARDSKFRLDGTWISQRLVGVVKPSVEEASQMLQKLLDLGILVRNADGTTRVVDDQFHRIHPTEFNFFRSHLELTAKSFDHIMDHRPNRFETGVHAFSQGAFNQFLEELQTFVRKTNELAASDTGPAKRVFLVNHSAISVADTSPVLPGEPEPADIWR